jgi:UDP-2,3-diacylglucosamine pyrophosphatase LpxH
MALIDTALERLKPLKRHSRFTRKMRESWRALRHGPPEADVLEREPRTANRYRTIFISDTHLGTRGCKAELLVDFLRRHECDRLYLIGDIVDVWRLRRSWYWPQSHNDIALELLRKVRAGTKIIYVPGNHDELARDYIGLTLGGVEVAFEMVHETVDGRRFLIMHGDHFDGIVKHARWLAHLGDWAYAVALGVNDGLNFLRRRMGLSYWSLSAYLKHKVKNAVEYVSNYETAIVREALHRKVDGVICGHIHHAEMREIDGILYCNDGDWVESCTALVEAKDGALSIIHWSRIGGEAETLREVAAVA